MGTSAISFKKVFCAPKTFPSCLFSPVEFLRSENYLSVSHELSQLCHEFLGSLGGGQRLTQERLTARWLPRQVVRPDDTEQTQGVFILRKGFSVMVSSSFGKEAGTSEGRRGVPVPKPAAPPLCLLCTICPIMACLRRTVTRCLTGVARAANSD